MSKGRKSENELQQDAIGQYLGPLSSMPCLKFRTDAYELIYAFLIEKGHGKAALAVKRVIKEVFGVDDVVKGENQARLADVISDWRKSKYASTNSSLVQNDRLF
jgi:hypothetical protein